MKEEDKNFRLGIIKRLINWIRSRFIDEGRREDSGAPMIVIIDKHGNVKMYEDYRNMY